MKQYIYILFKKSRTKFDKIKNIYFIFKSILSILIEALYLRFKVSVEHILLHIISKPFRPGMRQTQEILLLFDQSK